MYTMVTQFNDGNFRGLVAEKSWDLNVFNESIRSTQLARLGVYIYLYEHECSSGFLFVKNFQCAIIMYKYK